MVRTGLYPIVWLAPGQVIKVSKCEEEEQSPVVPLEEVSRGGKKKIVHSPLSL